MAVIPTFNAVIRGGRLFLHDPGGWGSFLKTMDGKEVKVSVKRHAKERSNEQNRYYWGVIVEILARELGYFPDEMHDALKFKFLLIQQKPLPKCRSTSDLSTGEMEQYHADIRAWASSELNIYIPLPHEAEIA